MTKGPAPSREPAAPTPMLIGGGKYAPTDLEERRFQAACAAMIGILAGKASNREMWCEEWVTTTAEQAVARGDALLAELERTKK